MKFALPFLPLVVALSVTSPAFADSGAPSATQIKRAADAFDRGREAYRAENYVEAAEHFEAADGHAPSAAALRFALLSRQEAGQVSRAATLAALALARHPDDAELVELAQSVVDEASSSLFKLEVSCDEPCELVLNNKIVHGQRAKERVLYLDPGTHRVRASFSDNRTREESVDAVAGDSGYVVFHAPPLGTSASATSDTDWDIGEDEAPSTKERNGWSPVVFWTGVGLTVAGGAASTLLGLRAVNDPGRETVKERCQSFTGSNRADCPEYQKGLKHERQANFAIAATSVVGVLTVITGLFLTDWESDDPVADSAKKQSDRSAQAGLTVRPWFGVGETTALGAVGTF